MAAGGQGQGPSAGTGGAAPTQAMLPAPGTSKPGGGAGAGGAAAAAAAAAGLRAEDVQRRANELAAGAAGLAAFFNTLVAELLAAVEQLAVSEFNTWMVRSEGGLEGGLEASWACWECVGATWRGPH